MERVVLHSDLDNFYASVECLYHPELRNKPMAVGGDPEQRHGIILAKNYPAKSFDIKTGETIWQAKQKCPQLIVVKPNFKLYLQFSRLVRQIYTEYTNQVEPFGLDEAWLDVTGSTRLYGNGETIANKIRHRIKEEMGITVSIGVSFNKVFAKLGSEMKKPDATTIITKENYKHIVWPLPVGDLLYVGTATQRKLKQRGISTIGELAQLDPRQLYSWFGKWGNVLYAFANGLENSPVTIVGEEAVIKSIGNSTTTPHDLENNEEVAIIFYVLCESVAARLREHGLECRIVEIYVRDNELVSFIRQQKQSMSTNLASEIHRAAMELFRKNYSWAKPIRSIGVRGSGLVPAGSPLQLTFMDDEKKRQKIEHLETTIDQIRQRFGTLSVQRALLLTDQRLSAINPKDDHTIHPVGYFKAGSKY